MRKLARVACLLVLPLGTLRPQAPRSPCLDSLHPDSMAAVRVWLVLAIPDSSRAIRPHAEAFTWALADQLRARLALGEGELRDAGLGWRDLYGEARVFVRPNGTFWWRFETEAADAATRPRAYVIMDSALTALATARPIAFPIGAVRRDSTSFVVDYQWATVRRDGTLGSLRAFFAIPLFTVRRPWEEPVSVTRMVRPRYPEYSRHANVQGTIEIHAVVDTNGRADTATVKDFWPPDVPRAQHLEQFYRDFVAASRESVIRTRYRPAVIGGCTVRQMIAQQFNFSLVP